MLITTFIKKYYVTDFISLFAFYDEFKNLKLRLTFSYVAFIRNGTECIKTAKINHKTTFFISSTQRAFLNVVILRADVRDLLYESRKVHSVVYVCSNTLNVHLNK